MVFKIIKYPRHLIGEKKRNFRDKIKNHAFLCHLCHCRIRLVTLMIWSLGLVPLESAGLVLAVRPSSPELADWPIRRRTVYHHSLRWATWTFRLGTCHFGTFELDCSNKNSKSFLIPKKVTWCSNSTPFVGFGLGRSSPASRFVSCDSAIVIFLFFKIRKEKLDFRLMLFFVLLLNRLRPSISCM